MRLGLDIDGTIAADPKFFSASAAEVLLAGGEVHVVTSRSPEGRRETVAELRDLGIKYSALYLLQPMSVAQKLCPHANLDWYQRHAWLKVAYALEQDLGCFVDDDAKVLALFDRYAPSINAISFLNRNSMRLMG